MKRHHYVWVIVFLFSAAATLAAQSPPACVPPPAGLVSWWPGEGNAVDIQSGDSGTTPNGLSFTSGKVGQAFQFDGDNQYILAPHPEKYDFGGGPYSFALWVQTLGGREIGEHVFSKGKLWSGNDDYVMWISGLGGPDHAVVAMEYGWPDSNYVQSLMYYSYVNDGMWHHVVVTQSGACEGCWRLYLDSVLQSINLGKEAAHGTEPFIIGGVVGGDSSFYGLKGGIDELAVFNRALTADEVLSLFSADSAGMCRNQSVADAIASLTQLVASYNLKQGIANSFDTKLQNALAALGAANAGQRQDAANKLMAFINAVEAQRGKELTTLQADELIAVARRVLNVL
ncbi:MAG: LamG domain-containing protein [Terriglobales bacterium]